LSCRCQIRVGGVVTNQSLLFGSTLAIFVCLEPCPCTAAANVAAATPPPRAQRRSVITDSGEFHMNNDEEQLRERRAVLSTEHLTPKNLSIYGGVTESGFLQTVVSAACEQSQHSFDCGSEALLDGVAFPDMPCDDLHPGHPVVCPFATCEALGPHCHWLLKDGELYGGPWLKDARMWENIRARAMIQLHHQANVDTEALGYRSHYGDLQHWHAMAPFEPSTNAAVLGQILGQVGVWYSELLSYDSLDSRLFDLGRILHVVQASFSDTHVMRSADGRVVLFQTRQCQMEEHPKLLLTPEMYNRAVNATAMVMDMIMGETPASALMDFLRKDVFAFAPGREGAATGVGDGVPCCTSSKYAKSGAAACDSAAPYTPVDHVVSLAFVMQFNLWLFDGSMSKDIGELLPRSHSLVHWASL